MKFSLCSYSAHLFGQPSKRRHTPGRLGERITTACSRLPASGGGLQGLATACCRDKQGLQDLAGCRSGVYRALQPAATGSQGFPGALQWLVVCFAAPYRRYRRAETRLPAAIPLPSFATHICRAASPFFQSHWAPDSLPVW